MLFGKRFFGLMAVFAISLMAFRVVRAEEVLIADYLQDKGADSDHTSNQQLNATGTKDIHGWKAFPVDGNHWTSISYVDEGGKTLGDKRDAIAPAEGKSYLRMFTQNSSDWLTLQSPEFPLKQGATYLISFKIAADSQPPMSRLEVSLGDRKGGRYGLTSHDLLSLEPGWNTIIFRCEYDGPDQLGFLQLTGRRERTGKTGSLNIDDFKTPSKEDMDRSDGGDVSGSAVVLPLQKASWNKMVMPLEPGVEVSIPISAPVPGKYHVMVKLRSSDRSGNEGDSMLGGYTYLLPWPSYKFAIDGRPVDMKISPRMVVADGREQEDIPVFNGWVYSPEPIAIDDSSRLTVTCTKSAGFISEVVLLDEAAWAAEKLRSSGKFVNPPGKGFGDAWAGMLTRPTQWYPLKSLRRTLEALEIFENSEFVKKASGGVDFSTLLDSGKTLASRVEEYLRKPVRNDAEFQQEGAILVKEWVGYFSEVDKDLTGTLRALLDAWEVRARNAASKANPQCFAGRETLFNAKIASQYITECRDRIKSLNKDSEVLDGVPQILILTFAQNSAEFMLRAEEFSDRPQISVSFPEYEIREENDTSAGRKLTSDETLIINGQWSFAPGDPDRPPEKWVKTNIPNNGPAYFFNKNNISDDQWSKDFGIYWAAGSIKNAWFKTDFEIPADWRGSKMVVRFEELMLYGEVFVNGYYCGNHYGGFAPFEIDVTDRIVPGHRNNLLVFVSSHSKTARGQFKDIRDKGMTFGNLYPRNQLENNESLRISGDVEVIAKPALRIENTYVRTSVKDRSITVQSTIVNDTDEVFDGTLVRTVTRKGKSELVMPPQRVRLVPKDRKVVTSNAEWKDPLLWGIGGEYGEPSHRYILKSVLTSDDHLSEAFTEFGFRELTISGRDFLLNGIKLPLQGDSYSDSGRYQYQHNRWVQAFTNKFRRMANINLVRPHRFNFSGALLDASNWSGMLVEGEAPWWSVNLYAPSDITGKPYFEDPVWLSNAKDYYHAVLTENRNEPSMVLWSAENESLTADNVDAVMKFRKWSEEVAPHLIITDHSHASAWDARIPVAILHDYDLGVERIREWSRVSETAPKPGVIGEFWNIDLYRKMWMNRDHAQAKAAERIMAKWLERTVRSYQDAGTSGSMPYTFNSLGTLYSNGSIKTMGPWGDLISERWQDAEKKDIPVVVYPTWPSVSGRGGIKPDKKRLGGDNYSHINIFDSARPVATLTTVLEGYRKAFTPMPQNVIKRPPEILIQVLKDGIPVACVNVFAVPRSGTVGEPIGVKGDQDGKSWLQLAEAGTYDVFFTADGKKFSHEFKLEDTPLGAAGFEYLSRVKWDISSGTVDLTPGEFPKEIVSVMDKGEPAAVTKAEKVDRSELTPVSSDGFIRRWLVYGPFPNYGGRRSKGKNHLEVDLLAKYGGEIEAIPSGGTQLVPFQKTDHTYWDTGVIDIAWHVYASEQDKVDLSNALIRPGFSGLDGSLQYVFGYAACYIESDDDQEVTLSIGSDDGYKIWLNHQEIASKRVYRACVPDSEKYVVKFKKGSNLLLLKVEQDDGGFEFALRFLDEAGKPLVPRTSVALPKQTETLAFNKWLQNWLVMGPFPNGGERPNGRGVNTDYLESVGGESGVKPIIGEGLEVSFPEDDQAYWEKGKVHVKWRAYEGEADDINLGDAFVRPEVPGLDVAPVQYVTGYAWTEFNVSKGQSAILEVNSYNGLKIWLNGTLVVNDPRHTYNRDPNSAVLPESKEKELRTPVMLNTGLNRVLVKPDVDYGPLTFRMRFLDGETKMSK